MARSGYGKVLGWGLAIGAVAGAMSLFRGKAKASTVPVAPRVPTAKGPKQKFSPGDEVTVTGGPTGSARTYIVRGATLTPTGWQYDLGEGAPMPQGSLHFVSSAAERGTAPVMVKAAPVVPVAPAATMTLPPEVVTHSTEFLAREKAAKVAAKAAATKAASTKAAPNQGGPKMTQRQQRITDLLGLVKTEKDAAKLTALKAELVKLAQEESAALKAAEAKAAKGPFYMPGLQAKFGKITANITEAHQDAQGAWHYTTVLSGTPFGLKDGTYPSSETDLRQQLSERLNQPLAVGQAYPAGLEVYRRGQGGVVQNVTKNAAGEFVYQIQGWPNAVTQSELLGILARA